MAGWLRFTVSSLPETNVRPAYYTRGTTNFQLISPSGSAVTTDIYGNFEITETGTYYVDITSQSGWCFDLYLRYVPLSYLGWYVPADYTGSIGIVNVMNTGLTDATFKHGGYMPQQLHLGYNPITQLTFDYAASGVVLLYLENTAITSLTVSQGVSLQALNLDNTKLQTLNVATLTDLDYLYLRDTYFTQDLLTSILVALVNDYAYNGTLYMPPVTLSAEAESAISTLESRKWTINVVDYTVYSDSASGTEVGTSGATSVVLQGLLLGVSTPVAGQKGLLINGEYFVPFVDEASLPSGGGGSE